MDNRRVVGGSQWPIVCPLAVFLLVLGVFCSVCVAGSLADRSEREPGDRESVDGFVGSRRYPAKEQELEPGDAVDRGDFTHTDTHGQEVEPNDGGVLSERVLDRRGLRLQNTIQEPRARHRMP